MRPFFHHRSPRDLRWTTNEVFVFTQKNNYFSKWKTLELKIATTKVRYSHSGCTISQLNVCIRHPEKQTNISYSRSSFFTMVKEKCLVKFTLHTHFMTTKVLLLSPIIDPFVKKKIQKTPQKTKQNKLSPSFITQNHCLFYNFHRYLTALGK